MGSGLPDYYRGMDVAYNVLSHVIVRPRYGGALLKSGSKQMGQGESSTLFEVLGKGMTYGGLAWLDHTSTQANAVVRLVIDGVLINNLSLIRMKDYGINNPKIWPVVLLKYDAVNFIYSVGVSFGLTFEESLKMEYYEKDAAAPTVHWRFVYTLI